MAERICSIPDCDGALVACGWCFKHYMRWRRNGHTEARPWGVEPHLRFWDKVAKSDGCWEWTATKRDGYGLFHLTGHKMVNAHRFSYELLVGPIPSGLTLDHLCRNRACVNPDHLEPVTQGENTLRGNSPHAINKRRTHCANGHEFSPANTYITPKGYRVCRQCQRNYHDEHRAELNARRREQRRQKKQNERSNA